MNNFLSLLSKWLPDGNRCGDEYIALNPTRPDKNKGSFKINIRNGRWCDFSTGDKGGDPISLAAYLFNIKQIEALHLVAEEMGV